MFSTGFGPILHNINSMVEGSGGYQQLGQRHYEEFSAELDNILTGGGTERIAYRQTVKAWLGYKALYLLLFALRLGGGIWGMMRDTPMNQEQWLGALALATMVPAVLLAYHLLYQLLAKPLMTPNTFLRGSRRMRRYALLDTAAQLVVGVLVLRLGDLAMDLPTALTLLAGAVCSFVLWLLEKRRKCTVYEQ